MYKRFSMALGGMALLISSTPDVLRAVQIGTPETGLEATRSLSPGSNVEGIKTEVPAQAKLGGGGKISFEVRPKESMPLLFSIDPDGGNYRDVGGQAGYLSAWSPNGKRIVFCHPGNNRMNDLFIVNSDGSDLRRLTDTPAEEGLAAWRPDGKQIAVSVEHDGGSEIYLLDPETGDILEQLTDNKEMYEFQPSWSPDGSQILFVRRTEDWDSAEILIMGADGGDERQITDNEVQDFYPAWSPDGACLVFVSERDGNSELYSMSPEGTNIRRLTDSPERKSKPQWSPDGTLIVFHSRSGGDHHSLYLLDVARGEIWLLIEGGVHPSWSWSGQD